MHDKVVCLLLQLNPHLPLKQRGEDDGVVLSLFPIPNEELIYFEQQCDSHGQSVTWYKIRQNSNCYGKRENPAILRVFLHLERCRTWNWHCLMKMKSNSSASIHTNCRFHGIINTNSNTGAWRREMKMHHSICCNFFFFFFSTSPSPYTVGTWIILLLMQCAVEKLELIKIPI